MGCLQTHVKTKLFYGPCLTYLFDHYSVPLTNQPDLVVKSKPLGASVVEKMEQAFERVKTLKSARPSSFQAPAPEESSSEDSDEEKVSKEHFDSLQKQIDSISTRLDEYHIESSRRSVELERQMNQGFTDIMGYLQDRFPPNP